MQMEVITQFVSLVMSALLLVMFLRSPLVLAVFCFGRICGAGQLFPYPTPVGEAS